MGRTYLLILKVISNKTALLLLDQHCNNYKKNFTAFTEILNRCFQKKIVECVMFR